jgi:DNA-binding transcriptional MerR regulator
MTVFGYITVMFTADATSLSLEELAAEAQRLLQQHGLYGAQPDARVSAAPDARTVRYYTTLGLLDRPGYEGREARYGRRHLVQLVAIKALQAQGLSLSEVQQRLYGRSEQDLLVLAEALAAEAAATGAQIELPAAAFRTLHEVSISPGLRLLAEPGWLAAAGGNAAALESVLKAVEEKVRAALAALAREEKPRAAHASAHRGAGGK